MRKFSIALLFVVLPWLTGAQNIEGWGADTSKNGVTLLEANENYIISFRLDSAIYSAKCPCFYDNCNKCILIRGEVLEVFYTPDKIGFLNPNLLRKISYLVVPKGELLFENGQVVNVSVSIPRNKNYYLYVRIREVKKGQT